MGEEAKEEVEGAAEALLPPGLLLVMVVERIPREFRMIDARLQHTSGLVVPLVSLTFLQKYGAAFRLRYPVASGIQAR